MLYNESDLIDALHRQEGFRRSHARCLWFAFEYGVVDSGLLVACGLADDVKNVANKHMIQKPLQQGWLEPNGVLIPSMTRPITQHRLTSRARLRMKHIQKKVRAEREIAEIRVRHETQSRT